MKENSVFWNGTFREQEIRTVVVGTGAAGYHAALRLHRFGEKNLAIVTEDVNAGTSRNTGSDKQTYYKLSLAGPDADSVTGMASDLFRGQCVDGDLALCEAALSARCFYHLMEIGVPFPDNIYGECMGYKTDHDRGRRASSVGPYTSKIMTECLERECVSANIPVLDRMQMIRILVREGRVCGILCLDDGRHKKTDSPFVIIWCENLVLATGGPAGMYRDSVYPVSQTGSSGIAFEAGVRGRNLTEWQFGMASLSPRWNVSGTYMQVLPRFVSTDKNGEDEKEFLMDYFQDMARMNHLIFLKGYQWPFDTNKIFGGSSLIDLLVYQETVLKQRRVYLDFTQNTGNGEIDFDALPEESREYLKNAKACFGTPIQRLEQMNTPAVHFYKEHGVDLHRERLEIAVCVQHNNGGLAVDADWQTNIAGIYAVGEAAGSHGVTRPGGSALNAGQVGALRAASHIAGKLRRGHLERLTHKEKAVIGETESSIRRECRQETGEFLSLLMGKLSASECESVWERATARMSDAGGMIRDGKRLREALEETQEDLNLLGSGSDEKKRTDQSCHGIRNVFRLYDILLSQKVYLSAMLDYLENGGGSRGSGLYTCPDGELPGKQLPELYRCRLDQGINGNRIQEIELKENECSCIWRSVRSLPEPDYFFETEWKKYREREGITEKIEN